MAAAGVLPSIRAWRQVRAELRHLRLQYKNLTKRLVREGTRRRVAKGSSMQAWIGKADSNISKGASGTISIWAGPEGSEADTSRNITAYNRMSLITSGYWVIVFRFRGRYYVLSWECAT